MALQVSHIVLEGQRVPVVFIRGYTVRKSVIHQDYYPFLPFETEDIIFTPVGCVVKFFCNTFPGQVCHVACHSKIVAGVDRIAVDAYCIALLDKKSNDVIKISKGYRHGLGEMDISKVKIHEEKL